MSPFSKLLAIIFIFMLFTSVLYVVFGQVTVRKLRKNPITKEALGLELVSGWDIINVAQALAFPKAWSKKLEKSQFLIHANSQLLLENTNKIDKLLGKAFYWTMIASASIGLLLIFLNYAGAFS